MNISPDFETLVEPFVFMLNPSKSSSKGDTRSVAILSPFALYSGHHFNYTRELTHRLSAVGTSVQVHTTHGVNILRADSPSAKIYSVCPLLRHLHRWLNIDIRRNGLIFKLLQNFETLACAISLWRHRHDVSAVYWQDARHLIMLRFVFLLSRLTHVNLVLGPIPFGGADAMKPRIRQLYRRAFDTGRFTVIGETKAVVDQWRKLAGKHVVEIPVALGEPPEKSARIIRSDLGIANDDFVCLLFGTHRADKDYRTVLRAAKASHSKPFLIFAGPVISDNHPGRLASEEGYAKTTFINKRIEEEETSAYFSLSDCAILPYAKNYEKGSAVLLQACKYDRPVITSRSGHLQRFVDEHQTGLYYEPEDPADLAAKIDEMARLAHEEPDHWKSRLAACRNKFSWENLLPRYLEVLGL